MLRGFCSQFWSMKRHVLVSSFIFLVYLLKSQSRPLDVLWLFHRKLVDKDPEKKFDVFCGLKIPRWVGVSDLGVLKGIGVEFLLITSIRQWT
jgi:hypothetical protein